MSWRAFFNTDHPLYVNHRHKRIHYRCIASDIKTLLQEIGAPKDAVVLDYGCGEALSAPEVARACKTLILCEDSDLVRQKLEVSFIPPPPEECAKNTPVVSQEAPVVSQEECAQIRSKIEIWSRSQFEDAPNGSLDVIVVNSVLQYMTRDDLLSFLHHAHQKLKPSGALVLADVLPADNSPLIDALYLLRFALAAGFFWAAMQGLIRTALSDYRKLRQDLGLSNYRESDLFVILKNAGYMARRRLPNLGHNAARMTFVALPLEKKATELSALPKKKRKKPEPDPSTDPLV
jgi:SAM-dependent methyltransferase